MCWIFISQIYLVKAWKCLKAVLHLQNLSAVKNHNKVNWKYCLCLLWESTVIIFPGQISANINCDNFLSMTFLYKKLENLTLQHHHFFHGDWSHHGVLSDVRQSRHGTSLTQWLLLKLKEHCRHILDFRCQRVLNIPQSWFKVSFFTDVFVRKKCKRFVKRPSLLATMDRKRWGTAQAESIHPFIHF